MSKEEYRDIEGREVRLTNLDKVFWPDEGYTKGDLINYYLEIADFILPHIQDRPQSLHRFPDGIKGEDFYQKDIAGQAPEWVKTQMVYSESNAKEIEYVLCQDKASLAYLVNLGCIDLNPWNSRVESLGRPDFLIIDLDPEDIGFDRVVETARTVRKVLDKAGIEGYPKTSGKTGIHIYIPLAASYDYDAARKFGQIIANLAHRELPQVTSIERMPAKRQQKVYLDYLQNSQGQTLAAPYSVRPVAGAQVSTPLRWDEVDSRLSPSDFTIRNIPDRLKEIGDIFGPVLDKGIDVAQVLDKLER